MGRRFRDSHRVQQRVDEFRQTNRKAFAPRTVRENAVPAGAQLPNGLRRGDEELSATEEQRRFQSGQTYEGPGEVRFVRHQHRAGFDGFRDQLEFAGGTREGDPSGRERASPPPGSSLDPELMGPIAAIGIVKGKPFAPDARMKKILTEALALANATSRILFMNPRDRSWYYYDDANWQNMLFATGCEFETPIPLITKEGVKPFPPTGYRQLDARRAFFYGVTGITPAMAMRLTGIGSTYLWTMLDSEGNYFDGAKTYKVTLPKDIPAEKFWSFTLYDTMTRSMLDTPQRYPRASSQSYPSPAAEPNEDGSTTVNFGPQQPNDVKRGNWIQTLPGKGFIPCLRLYSPLEPFFSKEWRPSEVELVK